MRIWTKKVRERIAALEETERKKSFSSKCNKQKGRENLDVLQRFWSGLVWSGLVWSGEFKIELAEENVKASLLKKVLKLSTLKCCKWSVVS